MKRKKIDIDGVLKRHWKNPSDEQVEESSARVFERLLKHFENTPEDFNLGQTDDSPAGKAIRRFREIDGLVLRALQILDGKADFHKVIAIVNDLGEPADADDIIQSLKRLDRKGAISLKALFPREAVVEQDAVAEIEHFKAGNLAKEKS